MYIIHKKINEKFHSNQKKPTKKYDIFFQTPVFITLILTKMFSKINVYLYFVFKPV